MTAYRFINSAQFLPSGSLIDPDGLVAIMQHLLAKKTHTDSVRDKIDFLLVQFFSQNVPTDLDDNGADLAYVAKGLESVLGAVELKAPVWLNALDRVLDAARRCRSLDELLHGGILEQGRKAKVQAGGSFYLPVALVAFTRFGYLMRRAFSARMLADLNSILDGLTELEEKGVEAIDCRRAQFSAQEPVIRLRMICQSWKAMCSRRNILRASPCAWHAGGFCALSVDEAFGPGRGRRRREDRIKRIGRAAVSRCCWAGASAGANRHQPPAGGSEQPTGELAMANTDAPEFEISSAAPEWNPDASDSK